MAKQNPTKEQVRKRTADAVIPDDPRINLDEFQTAKLLNVSVHKLRRDRWAGGGIPFVQIGAGGAVRYRRHDIDASLDSGKKTSTSCLGAQTGGRGRSETHRV